MNTFLKKSLLATAVAVASIGFVKCDDDNSNDNNNDVTGFQELVIVTEFIENYASIASANYADTYNTAVDMQTKINDFLETPNAASLKEAQDAWLHARDFYGQTEAYREAAGPIDNEDLLGTEGQINAWPLDEGYIDYVFDAATGGTINNGLIADLDFELTEANIIAKNEEGKDDNISTGWHAIEFLLWGQDLNTDGFTTSGEREYDDYTTADYADRRAEYLSIVTDLLIKDLKDLNDTWAIGGSYRTTFEDLGQEVALTNILNGIGFISNGEVALERLDPAIDEGQENEHSCFSDNTTQDMWANTTGLNNIIVGSYTTEAGTIVTGTSLIDLVNEVNTTVGTSLETIAENAITKLDALVLVGQSKNFDEIISEETLGSGGPAGELSSALKAQGTAISEAATALGVSITIN